MKKKERQIMKIFQQGDVILKVVSSVPAGPRKEDDLTKKGILALGEATGHCHQLERTELDEADVFRINEELFMVVKKAVALKHQEHNPVTVPPGTYKVDIVRETDHLSGVIRRVAD